MTDVIAVGMCTPLGLRWRAGVAAMRAGIRRFVETQIELSPDEPLRACMLSFLAPHLDRTERMIGLGVTALTEALAAVDRPPATVLPMVLALPAEDGVALEVPALISALQQGSSRMVRIEPASAGIVREGRASWFTALARAEDMLRSGETPWVLVGAIDSSCDLVSLVDLARSNRVLGLDNVDGSFPGEGAVFMLLTGLPPRRDSPPCLGRTVAVATGREPWPYRQRETPSVASGLTDVLTRLRERAGDGAPRVERVLSCQPGDGFWTREFVQAYLRNVSLFPEPLRFTSIHESLGDVGAASGAILVACALCPTRGPLRTEPLRTLVYGCSDTGEVGACLVETLSGAHAA